MEDTDSTAVCGSLCQNAQVEAESRVAGYFQRSPRFLGARSESFSTVRACAPTSANVPMFRLSPRSESVVVATRRGATRAGMLAVVVLASVVGAACKGSGESANTPAASATVTAAHDTTKAPTVASVVPMPTAPKQDTAIDSATVARADRGRVQGPESAMWVVMISDFQCPYCKQWHDSSMKKLEKDYIATGKIRFAYLHLPLSSIHKHARAEAEAAMCASAQGKFWPYSELLFAAQPTVGAMSDVEPLLAKSAKQVGLNEADFVACRKGGAVRALVNNDIAQATQSGVQSTPSFIIGDFLVQGALPYPDFRKAIDTALIVRSKGKKP